MPGWNRLERGITEQASYFKRCDRCDSLLENSKYKDVKLTFSTNRKSTVGFQCIRCALKNNVTIEELDNYIADKLRLSHLFQGS